MAILKDAICPECQSLISKGAIEVGGEFILTDHPAAGVSGLRGTESKTVPLIDWESGLYSKHRWKVRGYSEFQGETPKFVEIYAEPGIWRDWFNPEVHNVCKGSGMNPEHIL